MGPDWRCSSSCFPVTIQFAFPFSFPYVVYIPRCHELNGEDGREPAHTMEFTRPLFLVGCYTYNGVLTKSVCPRPFCSVSELVSQPLPVGLWMLGPTQDPAQIGQKCQISPSAIWISNLSGVEFGIVHETDGRSLHVGRMHVGLLLDRRWSTRSVIPEQAEGESSNKSGSKPQITSVTIH